MYDAQVDFWHLVRGKTKVHLYNALVGWAKFNVPLDTA